MDKQIFDLQTIYNLASFNPMALIDAGLFYVISYYIKEITLQGEIKEMDRLHPDLIKQLVLNEEGQFDGSFDAVDGTKLKFHFR